MGTMKTVMKRAPSRWTCVCLHLRSKISLRHPLRCIGFHLSGIVREVTPNRGYQQTVVNFFKPFQPIVVQ